MSAAESVSPKPPSKIWTVGTLSYTTTGLIFLFAWLLIGDFSWSTRERSVAPMAQWYLKHLGVANVLFALLMSSFPAVVGLILSPIISVKSDRHRGRFGRRIPFLLVTTPIAALGMVGLGLTPILAKWVHGHFPGQNEILVSVICFGVFWAAFEFATIASYSVFGGLINDVVPKPLLGRFYGMFRAVSLIDGIIFNKWLLGKVETHYTLMFVTIGVFYGASFLWVCFKIKEGEYPPVEPAPPLSAKHAVKEVNSYFRECFSNGHYIAIFVMMTAAAFSFMPVNSFMIPYAESLGMNMDRYGQAMSLTFQISLVLAYPLGWLCDIFHPLRVSIVSLIGYALVAAWGAFFARSADTFAIALVMHGVLSGCYFTSSASLGQRLYPHSRFAQFASAAGILGSIATMVLVPAMGLALDNVKGAYHLTFAAGCLFTLIALFTAWRVHRRFMRLGGPKGYVAPE